MSNYILCVDNIGKTSLELADTFEKYKIKIINSTGLKNTILKISQNKDIKLIVWSVYNEDTHVFDDIVNFRKFEAGKNIPIIVVSNINKDNYVLKAIQAGASDFIIRPYNKLYLIRKITEMLGIRDYQNYNLADVEEKNISLSLKDVLLMNIKGALRGNYKLSFVMFSLDKDIDNILKKNTFKSIKKIIKSKIRHTDIVVEYDENKLVIICPYTDSKGIKILHDKLRKVLLNSIVLQKKLKDTIFFSSYKTYSKNYTKNVEQIILKQLESKLKVCMAITK